MAVSPRLAVGASVLVLAALAPLAPADEKPAVHKPKTPQTRQDLDRLEAKRLYALATLHERKNRVVEAVKAYEAARRLDPESAAIPRALIPLYLALDRNEEAVAACKAVLRLDPDDHATATLYARQLKTQDKLKDAVAVLTAATKSARLKDRPDAAAQLWFDLGQLQELAGDTKDAAASYQQLAAILENPGALMEVGLFTREDVAAQAAENYERIGKVSLKAGDPEAAVKAFEKAQKKDPARAVRLSLNLAQVYHGQKKYREALQQIEKYLRTQPQGVEAYEIRIALQRRLDRQADVVPELEASSGRDPNNLSLKLLLAREYRKAKQTREAEKVYLTLLEKHLSPDIYRGLFELYRDQGRPGAEKVLDLFNRAVARGTGDEKNPGNAADAAAARAMLAVLREDRELVPLLLSAAVRRLNEEEDRGEKKLAFATRGFLATLASRTKQLDHAERLYRSCLARLDGSREMEADVYSGLIRVLRLRYKHEAIVQLCKQGLKKAQITNRLLFHTELGRAYQYLEKHDEAVAAFAEAVKEAGKSQMLYCKRLYVDGLSAAGKHDEALAECQKLVKEYNQGGELREVRAALSQIYQAMGKHDLADRQLLLILESDPGDATANNDLGYVWADRNKNLDEAEKMIRKAIDLDRKQRTSGTAVGTDSEEDNAAYVDSLGWVLFRKGQLKEARAELERASKMTSGDDDPTVWDHLGDVYSRLKEPAKAVAAWKKALALYDQRTRRMQTEKYREIQEKIKTAE